MLKDGKSKMIDVHVVLLEDILVILQKQDDKLVLKALSSKAMNSMQKSKDESKDENVKYTNTSPVVPLAGLLTRNVATGEALPSFMIFKIDCSQNSKIYRSVTDRKIKKFIDP